MTQRRLWLQRHAPVLADAGVCYGITDLAADAPATRRAAQALAGQLPDGTQVRTSPLQRCELLAQCLKALRPGLTVITDPRLRELDFGAWEGQRWDAIARADVDAWTSDFAQARPAGNGETVAELMARVRSAWHDARGQRVDTLWITHAGVVRAALLLARGMHLPASAADWPADALGFGELRVLALA